MTLEVYVALLCSLAALVLTAQALSVRRGLVYWLAGFGGGLLLFDATLALMPVGIAPGQSAILVVLLAVFLLAFPARMLMFLPAGGLLSVLWAGALQAQGFPAWLAWLTVIPALAATLHYSKGGSAFCTPALLQEVLVLLLVAGLAIALVPDLAAGWETGSSLAAADAENAAPLDGSASFLLSALCFGCGALHAILKNHLPTRWKSQ
jgi:hypothetical protein